MKTPHYKPGDYYPEWEKLTPLESKPASEQGVKVGDLLVRMSDKAGHLKEGTVVRVCGIVKGNRWIDVGELCSRDLAIDFFAKLPQQPEKPQMRVVQKAKYKHDDCDAVHSEDGVEFEGKLYTPEELHERSKLFRRLYERQKKLTF